MKIRVGGKMPKRTNVILVLGTLVALGCGGKATSDSATGGGAGVGETGGTPINVTTGASGSATTVTTGASGSATTVTTGGGASMMGQGGAGGTSVVSRVPLKHRPAAIACDHERPSSDPFAPDSGLAQCHSHAECTAGNNGRCGGNGHDGWHCTYDECFEDSDCPSPDGGKGYALCQCTAGFRSDNNVCLGGDNLGPPPHTTSPMCRIDADCGDGYCSPTFGACGNYSGVVSYYCHTPDDECIDDTDCGADAAFGPYCAYAPAVGHWKCSNSQCAG
jgi:hypothetical protein